MGEFEHLLPIFFVVADEYAGTNNPHTFFFGDFAEFFLTFFVQVEVEHFVAPFATQFMTGIYLNVLYPQLMGLVEGFHQGELMEGVRLNGEIPTGFFCFGLLGAGVERQAEDEQCGNA